MKKNKAIKNSVENISDEKVSKILVDNISAYQESVITDRAISSWKDGMKPCGRRIIKSFEDCTAWNTKPTIKSAKIVGDTMGKYHAHGDSGIAKSLATLVNQLYPPVYGHGNWGSLTENPAATRYTECKLSEIGMKMLECSEVAEKVKNYTGEIDEYVDIPSRFPNFFVNGVEGIAVGIAVHIPDHNLEEVVQAMKYVLKHPDATTRDILKFIKGPDYRYGGKLLSTKEELCDLYESNTGSVRYECNYTVEKLKKGYLLTVTDFCPGFNPESFLNKLDDLYENKLITYKNDSSTRDEPCKLEVMFNDASVEDKIHKMLQKKVRYQIFSVEQERSTSEERDLDISVCCDNFVTLMKRWLRWRREVESMIAKIELDSVGKSKRKAELKIIVAKNLSVVKKSLEVENTEEMLKNSLKLADWEVNYVMSLNLSSIRKLEIEKLENEIAKLKARIKELEDDLDDPDKMVERELNKLKQFYKPRYLKV